LVGAAGLTLGVWASFYLSPRLSGVAQGPLIHSAGPEQPDVRRKFVS